MPRHKRLTVVDETRELEGVDVDPIGNVVIGVPVAESLAVPPSDNEQKENV